MNKFSNFMSMFTKIARLVVYGFLLFNLGIDLFFPGHLLKVDLVWWVTYIVLDTWYHLVITKEDSKTCSGNCKNCQKLNS